MRKSVLTLGLMAALVGAVVVALPSEAIAQYGHHYGHRHHYGYPYGYGHGYSGHGYRGFHGYGAYRSNYGQVRIEISPKELRDKAQVYVNEARVGVVDDFDGFYQRLVLTPGEYEIEVRLDGYRTLQAHVLVRPRRTHTIRHQMEPIIAN